MTGASLVFGDTQSIGDVTYTKINKQLNGKDLYTTGDSLTSPSEVYTITDGVATPVTKQCDMTKIGGYPPLTPRLWRGE